MRRGRPSVRPFSFPTNVRPVDHSKPLFRSMNSSTGALSAAVAVDPRLADRCSIRSRTGLWNSSWNPQEQFSQNRFDIGCCHARVKWTLENSVNMSTTASPRLSADKMRARLVEVLDACPVEHCNPADCPLFHLREMDFVQRLRWLDSLNPSDLEYFATYHYICMQLKLQGGCIATNNP